jgi:hypothetical protein
MPSLTVLGFSAFRAVWQTQLICDFEELYRYLIDDFIIQYCESLSQRDFTFKTEKLSSQKKGKTRAS